MDGADFVTSYFDGKLGSVDPSLVVYNNVITSVTFSPDTNVSRRLGIELDSDNRTLIAKDGGYYLVNWDSEVKNITGTPNASLWAVINDLQPTMREVELGGLDTNNELAGNRVIYLNLNDNVRFEFRSFLDVIGSFKLEPLVIDVSQLNSWQ
jgi:hypothetical protein